MLFRSPATDLMTGESRELNGCIELLPYGVKIYRLGPPKEGDKAPKAETVTVSVPAPETKPQPEVKPEPQPAPGTLTLTPTDIPLRYKSQDGTDYFSIPCDDPALEKFLRALTGK